MYLENILSSLSTSEFSLTFLIGVFVFADSTFLNGVLFSVELHFNGVFAFRGVFAFNGVLALKGVFRCNTILLVQAKIVFIDLLIKIENLVS